MGSIGGEELMQWEKMQASVDAREEKILVLVRLRPLSDKEISRSEVSDWECINETSILYRNSLQERSGLPTAYTFDRVFRGDCATREVYEEGVKDIALSVVSGMNSTIFAYGQTSSGKTYTMVGITEFTVADIYDYIQKHEERAFVLKFSAMEIYNESIRDLLSTDSTPLRVLDDPEKGTIVEKLTEETVRDWRHLKDLLSICEALRRTGETSLNDASSRSHQILRLTIESSAREFIGKDKSTTLAASVNFVDLAGSERASQALSAGARLKEGCHINRSLLTLSTVIRKLSQGRHGHINYRDSKLTRILQPSLGGNARTAIVCTLSPAQSHVEQSRNTLLFASCAKEVTTNAQVNVVMSDKALVKHLQKELARLESELRIPVVTSYPTDYLALLKRKDLQIAKLEKENRELTKQLDVAQSRVEDLLQAIASNDSSRQWEEECSVSESSYIAGRHGLNGREEMSANTGEDVDDHCKVVRCIEAEVVKENENHESNAEVYGESERMSGNATTTDHPVRNNIQNAFTYDMLEEKFQNFQSTIDSLVSHCPEEDISSSRSFNLTRNPSNKEKFKYGSSSPCLENSQHIDNSPPNEYEKHFPGRPEGFGRQIPQLNFDTDTERLSRSDSRSSVGSLLIDEIKAQTINTTDDDITSIHTFVAGLKEAHLQYEKQVLHGQEMGQNDDKSEKNVKDAGLDHMPDALIISSDWPQEFERQQKLILELWESCKVSLVHRTYFFLLFKGEPTDSIYMEVEVRRLTFLKERFSRKDRAVEDSPTLTLASSIKVLRREREMLIKLMQKRFTEDERNRLYNNWGIALDSKRRRLQLVNLLWSNTIDINHVKESASIVAKLIMFSEQGQALKEMFGLSFTPPRLRRRSFGWKHRNSMKAML